MTDNKKQIVPIAGSASTETARSTENTISDSMAERRLAEKLRIGRRKLVRTLGRVDSILAERVDTRAYYLRLVDLFENLNTSDRHVDQVFNEYIEIPKSAKENDEQLENDNQAVDARDKINRVLYELHELFPDINRSSTVVAQSRQDAPAQQQYEDSGSHELFEQAETSNSAEATGSIDPAITYEPQNLIQPPAAAPFFAPFQSPLFLTKELETKIPKFNGEATKFIEWWNLFHYYVDSQPIDVTEKCRIPKHSLVGRAAKQVCFIQINAECYDMMKETVRSKFGNTQHAKTAHTHRIINLCSQGNLDKNDKFVEFVTNVSQNVHALTALGSSFASLTEILSPIILKGLPERHRTKFCVIWRKASLEGAVELETLLKYLNDQASLIEEVALQARFGQTSSQGERNFEKNRFGSGKKDRSKDQREAPPHKLQDQRSQFSFAAHVPEPVCLFCSKDHWAQKCQKKMRPEERRSILEGCNACMRCFRKNHDAKNCRAKMANCERCGGRHNSWVCSKPVGDKSVRNVTTLCQSLSSQCNGSTLLQTAYLWVVNGGRKLIVRAILDPGAQKSFISEKIVQRLGLKQSSQCETAVEGVLSRSADSRIFKVFEVVLQSRFSDKSARISCLAAPKIVDGLLPRSLYNGQIEPLADARADGFSERIDMLIGADFLHAIYDGASRREGELTFSPTIFGWVIWGNEGRNTLVNSVVTSLGVCQVTKEGQAYKSPKEPSADKSSGHNLEFLWDTEFLGIEPSSKEEEQNSIEEMEEFFRSTIQISEEGRFIVSLPFRENRDALGDNQRLAYSRLMSLLTNLRKKPQMLRAVDSEISKIIESGYAEPASPKQADEKAYFLPILAVAKKSLNNNSLEIRLVKDGGARSPDEASLNDVLEKGPNYLPDLIKVFLQFRKKEIVIVADIKAAFNQFLINKKHRTFLRFYWPTGISENPKAPVREYWATVLDFGLICSPWLHCAGIRHHLDRQVVKRPKHAALLRELKETFYVDDFATGVDAVEQAPSVIETPIEVFEDGKFTLGKWKTNSPAVAKLITAATAKDNPEITFQESNSKFLGVSWNQKSDQLYIDVDQTLALLDSCVPSKRNILRAVGQLYDPLGIIATISINFKLLIQDLWTRKIDWDQALPQELSEAFGKAVSNLRHSKSILVPRALLPQSRDGLSFELHVFADSSLKAYGAVAYLKSFEKVPGGRPKSKISFLMAKSRVTPLEGV